MVGSSPTAATNPPPTAYKMNDKQGAFSAIILLGTYLGVVQLVERLVWDQEAAGSSPAT